MPDVPVILGHERALAQLEDAVATDRLHHAWLFEGPPGVGKHTVARWLALRATCEGPAPQPCGRCRHCHQVLADTHPDVIEVGPDPDKATTIIGVDRIREVVRTAAFHRFSAARRVVIIDPAEAMHASAANALLKTLEEPPPGTHFVLVASHAASLLPTIISRCQRLRFGPVAEDALAVWLGGRGVEDPDALARLAQGAPGAALQLADGGLDTRRELRAALLDALGGGLEGVLTVAEKRGRGKRQDWMPEVEALIEIGEELLRDVVVTAVGGERPRLHADLDGRLRRWTNVLWPHGVERCRQSLVAARSQLAANVGGQAVIEAWLTAWQRELGPAVRG